MKYSSRNKEFPLQEFPEVNGEQADVCCVFRLQINRPGANLMRAWLTTPRQIIEFLYF
jgi:hypothetical protein